MKRPAFWRNIKYFGLGVVIVFSVLLALPWENILPDPLPEETLFILLALAAAGGVGSFVGLVGEHRATTLQERRGKFDAKRHVNWFIENEREFVWQNSVYIQLHVAETAKGGSGKGSSLPLDEILPTVTKYQHQEQERERTDPIPLAEAFEKHPKLVILGEPGAGKSVSLKHMAVEHAKRYRTNRKLPIPVYVELGRIGITQSTLDVLIADQLDCTPKQLKNLLADERFVFFFDGLNEIKQQHRSAAVPALRDYFADTCTHSCCVSSRLHGYAGDISAETVQIEPMDEPKILEFLGKYLSALGGEQSAESVMAQIENDQRILSLASNPLGLSMIALVLGRPEGEDVPRSRGRLLLSYVAKRNELDRERGICHLEADQWTRLLAPLAYEMIDDGAAVHIEKDLCMKALSATWKYLVDSGILSPSTHGHLSDTFTELCACGLLIDKGETVEFQHPLVEEYFAACHLRAQGIDWFRDNAPALIEYYHWDEVLCNLMGILPEEHAQVALNTMAKWDISLAARCAGYTENEESVPDALIKQLSSLIAHPDTGVRSGAARLLGEIKAECAVHPLIKALMDLDFLVRWSAARALASLKSGRAIQPLVETIRNSDEGVRALAAGALGALKVESAVHLLIEALSDSNVNVRRAAAEALGALKSERAVQPLIGALKDPNTDVRWRAAQGLGEFKSERVIQPLIEALKDPEVNVRRGAAGALGDLKSERAIQPLIGALKDSNADVRRAAAKALGKLKTEPAVEPLIKALKDSDAGVRRDAARALGDLQSERAVQPLIEALSDSNGGVRVCAVQALEGLQPERAVQSLIGALKDPNADVRWRGAEALGALKSERAIQPLIEALKDPDADVRSAAAVALGALKSERAIQPLIEALKDPDADVRSAAAWALRDLESECAIEPLIEALKDPNADVRTYAVRVLAKLKSERAVQPLIEALKDSDAGVHRSAAQALGDLKSKCAVDPLIEALDDPDRMLREHAARALGELKSKQAVEPLIKALKDSDTDVRRAAVQALGMLKLELTVGPLIEALKDPNAAVRSGTARALGAFKSKLAIGPLIEALKDSNAGARLCIAEALAAIAEDTSEAFTCRIAERLREALEQAESVKARDGLRRAIVELRNKTKRRFLKILSEPSDFRYG